VMQVADMRSLTSIAIAQLMFDGEDLLGLILEFLDAIEHQHSTRLPRPDR